MGGEKERPIDKDASLREEEKLRKLAEQMKARMEAIRASASSMSIDEIILHSQRAAIDHIVGIHEVHFGEEAAQNMRDHLQGRSQRTSPRDVFPQREARIGNEQPAVVRRTPPSQSRGFFDEYRDVLDLDFSPHRQRKPFSLEYTDKIAKVWGRMEDRTVASQRPESPEKPKQSAEQPQLTTPDGGQIIWSEQTAPQPTSIFLRAVGERNMLLYEKELRQERQPEQTLKSVQQQRKLRR